MRGLSLVKRNIVFLLLSLVTVTIIIVLLFIKSSNNKYQIESFNSGSSSFPQWMQKAIEKTGSSINDLNVTSLDIYLDGSEPSFIDLITKDTSNKITEFQINPNDNTIFEDSIDFKTNEEVPLTKILECFSVADIYDITSAINSKSVHITSHFPINKFNAKDVPPDSLIVYGKTIYRDVSGFETENNAFDFCQFGVAGENESYFIYFLYNLYS